MSNLVPADAHKEEIEYQFKLLAYTDKLLWYDGSIDNYAHEVETEGDKYAFAIVHSGQVIGYVSFRVDWYASCAFNFGLIKFRDRYLDHAMQDLRDSTPVMVSAIREIIQMVKSYNLHRIDFRCVSGNPAESGYDGIIERFHGEYKLRKVDFRDNIKDRQGKYHDTIMYEMVKMEADR